MYDARLSLWTQYFQFSRHQDLQRSLYVDVSHLQGHRQRLAHRLIRLREDALLIVVIGLVVLSPGVMGVSSERPVADRAVHRNAGPRERTRSLS
jgi:hypothetical protein